MGELSMLHYEGQLLKEVDLMKEYSKHGSHDLFGLCFMNRASVCQMDAV